MELSPLAAVHALHRKSLVVADGSHAARNVWRYASTSGTAPPLARNCYSPKYLSAIAMPSS